MSKAEEIILEIDGKIAYAEATGNHSAKEELLDIKQLIVDYKNSIKNLPNYMRKIDEKI